MTKSETHDEMIEAICDYRKGWTNLKSAKEELGELAGLSPDIAAAFLKDMKRRMAKGTSFTQAHKQSQKAEGK